ncbi:MAG: CHC2 zinc finger domain-containing protein [Waddliaceae bacterium]
MPNHTQKIIQHQAQISNNQIEQIKDKVDLHELIRQHVDLKKEGNVYKGLCPFHDEKTPSFCVYVDHYHCYGCDEHGDAIDFLQEKLGITFRGAVARLSSDAGEPFSREYTNSEIQAIKERHSSERENREKKIMHTKNNAALEAQKLWSSFSEQSQNAVQCRYVEKKKITPAGVRFGKNPQGHESLVIPVRSTNGDIRSLQFISVDDAMRVYKSFLQNGEVRGNYFQTSNIIDGEPFYVAEGYATAISIYEATKHPVIAALSSGNIEHVINGIRQKHPDNAITICADIEEGEKGLKCAEQAASKYRCAVVFPHFPVGKEKDKNGKALTDFNDLAQVCGLDSVKEQLKKQKKEPTFQPFSLSEFLRRPEKNWLIKGIIGGNDLGMIFGPPGSGKSFVVIDMIMASCLGLKWAREFVVTKPLNVVYCAGEGISGLKSRFEAATNEYGLDPDSLRNLTIFPQVPQLFSTDSKENVITFIREWESSQEKEKPKPVDILFLDTLHSATSGAEENSAKDMGRVLDRSSSLDHRVSH